MRRDVSCFLLFTVIASTTVADQRQNPIGHCNVIQSILNDISTWKKKKDKHGDANDIPFVTLTYAQSLDGKIALLQDDETTSSNFPMSASESLRMTHALRSIHDAILVGGNTLLVDNPRLTNRLYPTTRIQQPRPIVLDSHLEHFAKLGKSRRAKNIIACCTEEAALAAATKLVPESVELLPCPINPKTGKLDLEFLLRKLKQQFGIRSVMVEGGASVLSSFLEENHLVDCLCITIAPKLLLHRGLPVTGMRNHHASQKFRILDGDFESSSFQNLACDSIFLGKLKKIDNSS